LTAIGIGLRGAATNLRQDLDKTAHNLRQLEGMAVQSLDELRLLIADLRPSHLDDLGLGPALRWYGNEIENRSELNVRVVAPGGRLELLPQTVSTALFRIAQEALTNVVKHAKAQNVFVSVGQEEGDIILEIIDDGKGFNIKSESNENKPTWGLVGMEERAALLGGKFHISSEIGEGTKIRVAIPYHGVVEEEVMDD